MGPLLPDLFSLKEGQTVKIYEEKDQVEESKVYQAEQILIDVFSESTQELAADLYQLGENVDISSGTMKQAKEKLGIHAVKKYNRWYWVWEK